MENSIVSLWREIEKNPFQAHMDILSTGGYEALTEFVRSMAVEHQLTLAVKPTYKYYIQRWIDLARSQLKEILPHNPSEYLELSAVSKGWLNKMASHIRRAHHASVWGRMVIRNASIVNPNKLSSQDRKATTKLVRDYNHEVIAVAKCNGKRFMSFVEFASSR